MLQTAHLLYPTTFPSLKRDQLQTLQVNLGYRCNQTCRHCHVNAGPKRTEQMDAATVELVLEFLKRQGMQRLDLTGGAPEMNPHFRYLVKQARLAGVDVIDRCNLTILQEADQQGLAEFLAEHRVEIVASLPCYLEDNVDRQRGNGVFKTSLEALKRLNELGYGDGGSGLELSLVYNPRGPDLPPDQTILEQDYRRYLEQTYGIRFTRLLALANMPIQRFGSQLLSKGVFAQYLDLLKQSFQADNLPGVMCRSLVSVDWRGYLFDCDFNQMLGMGLHDPDNQRTHLADWLERDFTGHGIRVAEHCYGCTAGQGSGCGGALG